MGFWSMGKQKQVKKEKMFEKKKVDDVDRQEAKMDAEIAKFEKEAK